MPILNILKYPDERLRLKAKRITQFDTTLQQLIGDMTATMYEAGGIGLAATQVNQQLKLFVMDLSEDKKSPTYFINPKIYAKYEQIAYQEGCLSVPGFQAPVIRAQKIDLHWQDINQNKHHNTFKDIQAVCIQHEMDHLSGRLFVDHLNESDRVRFLTQLQG